MTKPQRGDRMLADHGSDQQISAEGPFASARRSIWPLRTHGSRRGLHSGVASRLPSRWSSPFPRSRPRFQTLAKQKNAHAWAERSRDPRSHFDVILWSAPQLGTSAMERGFSPSRNLRVSAGSYFGSEEKIMRKNLSFEANTNRGTLNTG